MKCKLCDKTLNEDKDSNKYIDWQICSTCGPKQSIERMCPRCITIFESPLIESERKCPKCDDRKCPLCDTVTQDIVIHMCDKHYGILPQGIELSPIELFWWIDRIFSDRLDKIMDRGKRCEKVDRICRDYTFCKISIIQAEKPGDIYEIATGPGEPMEIITDMYFPK